MATQRHPTNSVPSLVIATPVHVVEAALCFIASRLSVCGGFYRFAVTSPMSTLYIRGLLRNQGEQYLASETVAIGMAQEAGACTLAYVAFGIAAECGACCVSSGDSQNPVFELFQGRVCILQLYLMDLTSVMLEMSPVVIGDAGVFSVPTMSLADASKCFEAWAMRTRAFVRDALVIMKNTPWQPFKADSSEVALHDWVQWGTDALQPTAPVASPVAVPVAAPPPTPEIAPVPGVPPTRIVPLSVAGAVNADLPLNEGSVNQATTSLVPEAVSSPPMPPVEVKPLEEPRAGPSVESGETNPSLSPSPSSEEGAASGSGSQESPAPASSAGTGGCAVTSAHTSGTATFVDFEKAMQLFRDTNVAMQTRFRTMMAGMASVRANRVVDDAQADETASVEREPGWTHVSSSKKRNGRRSGASTVDDASGRAENSARVGLKYATRNLAMPPEEVVPSIALAHLKQLHKQCHMTVTAASQIPVTTSTPGVDNAVMQTLDAGREGMISLRSIVSVVDAMVVKS